MDQALKPRIADSSLDAEELGQRLRAYRLGAGLKAEDIASALNISRAAVYLLEKGEIVKVDTLVRLARLFKVSLASLLGAEIEYYSTAGGYFERMRQLEQNAASLLVNFEPISFLLTSDAYLDHLRAMLLDVTPADAAAGARWEQQVEEVITLFTARKLAFQTRRPAITSLIGIRQIARFLRFGLMGRDDLPAATRKRRARAVRDEVEHILALTENTPIGVQIGVVAGSLPGVNFQIFRQQAGRASVGVSPLRLHEIPEVDSAICTVTSSEEAVALYEAMFQKWWGRTHKGSDGARLLRQSITRTGRGTPV